MRAGFGMGYGIKYGRLDYLNPQHWGLDPVNEPHLEYSVAEAKPEEPRVEHEANEDCGGLISSRPLSSLRVTNLSPSSYTPTTKWSKSPRTRTKEGMPLHSGCRTRADWALEVHPQMRTQTGEPFVLRRAIVGR